MGKLEIQGSLLLVSFVPVQSVVLRVGGCLPEEGDVAWGGVHEVDLGYW